MSGRPVERASDHSSVGVTADGLILIRTPEGDQHLLSVIRACEWLADTGFRDKLRRAVNAAPCPFGVIEIGD